MKLVFFLATVFLDTEAAFTSKHYANQKVYSNNTKQNLPNVKSQIACCNRCLSTQDCLGIKHEESTCTLVSNAFPIIESNPTNAEDIFMDQDVVKSYEKYPFSGKTWGIYQNFWRLLRQKWPFIDFGSPYAPFVGNFLPI